MSLPFLSIRRAFPGGKCAKVGNNAGAAKVPCWSQDVYFRSECYVKEGEKNFCRGERFCGQCSERIRVTFFEANEKRASDFAITFKNDEIIAAKEQA